MKTLTTSVVITKADIRPLGLLRGKVNADDVIVNDNSHPPGSLIFQGFAGRIHLDDGLYHGVYRWLPMTEYEHAFGEGEHESFACAEQLPGIDKPLSELCEGAAYEGEPNDGGFG